MSEGTLKEVLKGERTSHVICSDVIEGLKMLPEGCVHCAVTSPPYYGLRSYLPKGHTDKKKEIGLEETPDAYIIRMVEVFREVRRVLHPTGVCWINIGDSYSGGKTGNDSYGDSSSTLNNGGKRTKTGEKMENKQRSIAAGYQSGDLLGIPHRLSQAMQADGWILRADVVWVKQSAMPESVSGWRWERCRVKVRSSRTSKQPHNIATGKRDGGPGGVGLAGLPSNDWAPCPGCPKCEPNGGLVLRKGSWRPTRAHEHIFLFAKSDRYFCDGEAVRTKIEEATKIRDTYSRILQDKDEQFAVQHDHETPSNPAGANLRDWWNLTDPDVVWQYLLRYSDADTMPQLKSLYEEWQAGQRERKDFWLLKQQALDEGHYAAFPPSLPAMCIKAGTSQRGVCKKCGMPWARVVERTRYEPEEVAVGVRNVDASRGDKTRKLSGPEYNEQTSSKTLGWRPTCSCNADAIPALVLDPFTGSGTSGIVAQKLGRRFVGIDLSEEYIGIARRRIRRRGHGKAPPKDQKKEVGGFFS